MQYPKISVITVVFNNVKDIERTVDSVISQIYPFVEYLVIDGASTDGTQEIIQKHAEKIATYVSEKDSGIYDAMNKGLALATGDYVVFMNSGDEFFDEHTLENIFYKHYSVKDGKTPDILYGDTILIDENVNFIGKRQHPLPDYFTWKTFQTGMSICHQAIYVKRSICEPYDLNYQLSSDIDWVIRAAKKSDWNINVQHVVAKYLVGGMSDKKHYESLKERFNILSKHYGFVPNLFNHGLIALRYAYNKLANSTEARK